MVNKELKQTQDLLLEELHYLRQQVPAIERKLQRLERDKKIQKALYDIAEVTWEAHDMDELYQAIHGIVGELIYAKNMFIAVISDNGETVQLPYFIDEKDSAPVEDNLPIKEFEQTLTGYLIRTGQPLLLANQKQLFDLTAKNEFRTRGADAESWLGVPFKYQHQVLGAVVVQSYEKNNSYGLKDQELLIFVSRQIAAAIMRKRNEQTLQRSREFLAKKVDQRSTELVNANRVLEEQISERERAALLQVELYRIAKLTTTSTDLDAFFYQIHQSIARLMYADNFYVALLEGGVLDFVYVVDSYQSDFPSRPYNPDIKDPRGISEQVLSSGKSLLMVEGDENFKRYAADAYGTYSYSWLGVPITQDRKVIGVMAVQSYLADISHTMEDQELLIYVAQHVSTALQRKRDAELLHSAHAELERINRQLEQRVEERTQVLSASNQDLKQVLAERKVIEERLAYAACHDSLTGLPNRTLFLDRLENAIKRSLRSQSVSYAALFLDLDDFKTVNDTYGHLQGDRLLREVASRISSCVRPGDTVARFGGDEFCVLLDGVAEEVNAIEIAQRMLDAFATPVTLGTNQVIARASIGIALGKPEYQEAGLVIRDADAAMYQAKGQGGGAYLVYAFDISGNKLN